MKTSAVQAHQTDAAAPAKASRVARPAPAVGVERRASCACGGGCPRCRSFLQAKLLVGSTRDPLEHEADRMSEQVMRGPAKAEARAAPPSIQRSPVTAKETAGVAPSSVDRVLAAQGSPLPSEVQTEMSQRFGHDFSGVRVHTGSLAEASAKDVQAKAFTVGSNIVFGTGRYAPETGAGRQLLAHELTHVVQQTGPGNDRGANGFYLARSVDDWLQGSLDITPGAMGYTRLLAEVDELTQYLDRQTSSSPETSRIEEVVAMLRAEVNRRDTAAAGPGRNRRRGRTRPTAAAATPLPARYPRILLEMTSVAYADPEEMRAEYDLIMEWLARPEISRDMRRTLTVERDNLAPQVRTARERDVSERHAARVRTALEPDAANASQGLETMARTIHGMASDPGRPDVVYIYHQGERIGISAEQAALLRANLMRELGRAATRVGSTAEYYWDRYHSQLAINRDSPIIAGISGWLADVEDPGEELSTRYWLIQRRVRQMQALLRENRPVEAAAMLATADSIGQQVRQLSRAFYEGHIEGAQIAVNRLEFTRDASFAIAGAIAVVVAAPVVAGAVGVGGLGLTGVSAGVATTLGTGAVVGTGTAVVRGASAGTGELVAGGSLAQAGGAAWSEGARGFREGFIAGAGGGAARLLGPAAGALAPRLAPLLGATGSQIAARVASEAIVNGTTTMVDMLWQGRPLGEAVQAGLMSAASSVPGALLGGSNSPIVRHLVAPLTAGGTAYLNARLGGAPPEQAMQAAGIAVASSVATSRHGTAADDALVQRGQQMGASVRQTAVDVRNSARPYAAAVMMGVSDAVPPLRSGYGGTGASIVSDVSAPVSSSSSRSTVVSDTPDALPVSTTRTADADAPPPVVAAATPDVVPPAVPAATPDATPATVTPVSSGDDGASPAVSTRPRRTQAEIDAELAQIPANNARNQGADVLNADAAISETAPMQGGSTVRQSGRTEASGRSRDMPSLERVRLSGAQHAAARQLHGQVFNGRLRQAWGNTRNARERRDLQAIANHVSAGRHEQARTLARAAFDRHRNRFWAEVRRDPALRAIFTDAGMVFPDGGGAPVYRDPTTGDLIDRMTLEHQTRLHDDPARALEADNLQTVLGDENSVMLEFIRRNDPFQ